jgi:DNA-binding LytR/AlgR family response regulator
MEQATENPVQPRRDRWPVRRDEWRKCGTDGADADASGCRASVGAIYGSMAVIVAAACTVNAFSTAYDLAQLGRPYRYWDPFVWEWSSAIAVIALLVLPRQAARYAAGFVSRPLRTGFTAIGLALAFSALHIGGMILLRDLVYVAAGAVYSFHWSVGDVVYELRKDLFSFSLIAGVFWLTERAFARPAAARPGPVIFAPVEEAASAVAPAAEPAAAGSGLWLRDGRTSILIDAGEILWITSAGNYVEYAMANGRRHLIRTTLQVEAERLAKFGIARVHRTRLVNVSRIAAIAWRPSGDFDLTLDTGEAAVGSRRYKAAVAGIGTSAPPQAALRP